MTNERARARALCMNEYDGNIVSLLSKLFRSLHCTPHKWRKQRGAEKNSCSIELELRRANEIVGIRKALFGMSLVRTKRLGIKKPELHLHLLIKVGKSAHWPDTIVRVYGIWIVRKLAPL